MTNNKKLQQGNLRWITITTLFLAIGVILRIISPNIGAISLNWNIVMYTTAILLCRPSLRQGFGIGLVSGIIAMMTSKAILPYANLISDPLAGFVCALLAKHHLLDLKIGRLHLESALLIFITTFISGGTFVTLTKIALSLPMPLYLYVMMPVVLLVAVLGSIAGQLLYFPAAKIFGSSNEQKNLFFLHNINLHIKSGSFFIITGVNGSGKTSLLLRMAGIIPNYFGGLKNSSITIGNLDICKESPSVLQREIGLVMADYESQLVTETVNDEIAFSLENKALSPQEIIKKRTDVLQKTGLTDLGTRKVASLSGGQKQRLLIATVLAMDTPIIMLDEPVAAVDPEGAKEIYDLLAKINREDKKTIIVVEHDLKYILPIDAQMAVIDKSYLKFVGAKDECLQYMYKNKVYPEVIPFRWKIRWEMRNDLC